ncbi:hypothetical protein ACFPK9_01235 [Rubritalea spongiae]|uniref:Uncharacterized protein n=1 Tax=Rubritalea spongiae TaxID=430797 RepID=A0ABW5DZC0_9BACT
MIDQALQGALGRDVLPSALSSAELRDLLEKELRERSVFIARTTKAEYLQGLRSAIERALQGGYNNDLPRLKQELRGMLTRLKYTPENGFPGDETLGIPPAEAGSLRDLSSDKRLNLILETEIKKHRGAAQKARGNSEAGLRGYPAWELVRVQSRREPRGMPGTGTLGWQRRWFEVGGPTNSTGRLIALKTDPVWKKLGSSSYFDDALDTEHPPFAFNSGMGWRAVSASELEDLGIEWEGQKPSADALLPVAEKRLDGMDDDLATSLLGKIKAKREGKSKSARYESLLQRELAAAKEGGVV